MFSGAFRVFPPRADYTRLECLTAFGLPVQWVLTGARTVLRKQQRPKPLPWVSSQALLLAGRWELRGRVSHMSPFSDLTTTSEDRRPSVSLINRSHVQKCTSPRVID